MSNDQRFEVAMKFSNRRSSAKGKSHEKNPSIKGTKNQVGTNQTASHGRSEPRDFKKSLGYPSSRRNPKRRRQ